MIERIHAVGANPEIEPTERPRRRTLVVDFDGTITRENTLELAVARFGDMAAHRRAEAELGRTLTLHDLLARSYGSLRASREEVVDWLVARTRFRRGVASLVALARERGWRLVIVSSGPRQLIEPLLRREGMGDVELVANALEGTEGWRLSFLDGDRCDVCGEACKRRSVAELAAGDEVVYVGDGYSDGCAAELADVVFARRRLKDYLRERRLRFEPFDDFLEIAESLEGGSEGEQRESYEHLAARVARSELELRVWRELAASAESRLAAAEVLHSGRAWRALVRVMTLVARVAPPSSRRDRVLRAVLRAPRPLPTPPCDEPRRAPRGPRAALFVAGRPGATQRYRCELQAERLACAGASVDVVPFEDVDFDDVLERYRLVVLARVPFDVRVGSFLAAARERGVAVHFDTDDLIFDESAAPFAPRSALLQDGLLRHRQTLALADAVTVSTEPLRAFAGSFHERVAVLPNAVGEKMVRGADEALAAAAPRSPFVTLAYFSGTATHDRDFLEAADAVLWALDRHPDARFLAVGPLTLDERFARFGDRVEQLPAVPWEELPRLLVGVDVNLAPLERGNPFGDCKSCIKYLEAGLLGVPTVASPRPDFLRVIESGRNGLLADSPDEWRAALERLLESPAERHRLGQGAFEDVRREHTTTAQALDAARTLGRLVGEHRQSLRVNWVGGGDRARRLAAELEAAGHQVQLGFGAPADVIVAADATAVEAVLADDRSLFRVSISDGAGAFPATRRPRIRNVDVELPPDDDDAAWRDVGRRLVSILTEACFLRLDQQPTNTSPG